MKAAIVLAFILLALPAASAIDAAYCRDNIANTCQWLQITAVDESTNKTLGLLPPGKMSSVNGITTGNFSPWTSGIGPTSPLCYNLTSINQTTEVYGKEMMFVLGNATYIARSMSKDIPAYSAGGADVTMVLYLAKSGDGIYHSIYVLKHGDAPLEGAKVLAQKAAGSYYETITAQKTDGTGLALNYLLQIPYHFVVTASGYTPQTTDSTPNPTNPIIYIRLTGGGNVTDYVNFSTVLSNVSYSFSPVGTYHNSSINATFTLSDADSLIEYQAFNVSYSNGTLLCYVYVDTEPSGTLETCTIPFQPGVYDVRAYFKKTGYDQYNFNRYSYYVYNSTTGLAALDIRSSVSDLGYFIVLLFLATVGGGFAARFTDSGSATGAAVLSIVAMGIGLNPGIVIAGISGWYILGATISLLAALLILEWSV